MHLCLYGLLTMSLRLLGVLNQSVWAELKSLDDPELRALADSLPNTVLQSRAPSTVRKYTGAFLRWKKWATNKPGVEALPAVPIHVALYLQYLVQKGATVAPVVEAVNALSWAHQVAVVDDPTSHPLVRSTLAGARRILARPVSKKEPVTKEMLHELVVKFGGEGATLSEVRTLTICLIGFTGFLRYDETASLKETDISLYEDHMELFIESSKTDQFRDGSRLVIARSGSITCPVRMLERYLQLAEIDLATPRDRLLFRALVKTKLGYKLRDSGGLSYTRAREIVLEMLGEAGYDKTVFGLHSLRSGGASAAASAGVPDRLFKRHGRWRSENAKDGYIKDALTDRLSVTKGIGM